MEFFFFFVFIQLLAPEDLLHACEIMESLKLNIRYALWIFTTTFNVGSFTALYSLCYLLFVLFRFRVFDSGVMVLQSRSHNEEEAIEQTVDVVSYPLICLKKITKKRFYCLENSISPLFLFKVKKKGSATAEELSQLIGVSVILARER